MRRGSYNTSLLRAAIEVAPEDADVALWDGIGDLPIYNHDLESADLPESVRRLRVDWAAADAILFSTPEYNGSVPGGLKNAVDWASRPIDRAALRNKNVAVVGASTSQFGALWAQSDLRKLLGVAGARVIGDELPVNRAPEKFDAGGNLIDAELSAFLRLTLERLVAESTPIAATASQSSRPE